MHGAGKRLPRPSGAALEVREAEISMELTSMFITDYNHQESIEELRGASRLLRRTFEDYSSVIVQYVSHLRESGAKAEASDLIASLNVKKASYRDTIKQIQQRRGELNDDNITDLTPSEPDLYATGGASVMSASTKVKAFLEAHEEEFKATRNIDHTPKTTSSQGLNPVSTKLPTERVVTCSDNINTKQPFPPASLPDHGPMFSLGYDLNAPIYTAPKAATSLHNTYLGAAGQFPASYHNFEPLQRVTSAPFQPSISLPYGNVPSSLTYVPQSSQVHPIIPQVPYSPQHPYAGDASRFLIKRELKLNEGEPFNGDPTLYHNWARKLMGRVEGLQLSAMDMIELIEKNTSGEAKAIVKDYQATSLGDAQSVLQSIWAELGETFGSADKISQELDRKLEEFSPIKNAEDPKQLRELVRICRLIHCNIASIPDLAAYNTSYGLTKVYKLLPAPIFTKWRRAVAFMKRRNESPDIAKLIAHLSGVIEELTAIELPVERKTVKTLATSSLPPSPNIDTSSSPLQHFIYCPFHETTTHRLEDCVTFSEKSYKDRKALVKSKGLCFSCLGNHFMRDCKVVPSCTKCSGKHNSVLHDESAVSSRNPTPRDPQQRGGRGTQSNNEFSRGPRNYHRSDEASGGGYGRRAGGRSGEVANYISVSEEGSAAEEERVTALASCSENCRLVQKSFSKVLLVEVTSRASGLSKQCYCIIDEQSTSSFISPELATALKVVGDKYEYDLRTLSGINNRTEGNLIYDLSIRGVNESRSYDLPVVVTNDMIPNCLQEVASPEVVRSYPHVSKFHSKFSDMDPHSSVMILLGRDSGDAMQTKCYGIHAPFVHHTALGWALVGGSCNASKSKFPENSFVLKVAEIPRDSPRHARIYPESAVDMSNAHLVDCFTQLPDDETCGESRDDARFSLMMEEGTTVNSKGNLVYPLPFVSDDIIMPDNRVAVLCRTRATLERFRGDTGKLLKCTTSMQRYLDAGHVEYVSPEKGIPEPGKVWYLPIMAVFQEKKNNARLVFDSSAKFRGVSLNDVLLCGPDRTTKLRAVLLRFRCGPIALSADIEMMFHCFYISESDRDYVRFFWFRDNDPSRDLVEMRATVHVFGNKPSPAVANHGLRTAAALTEGCERGRKLVNENMYVDDVLAAFDSVPDAVSALCEAREALGKFNIRLHKIKSNTFEVLDSFPPEDVSQAEEASLGKEETTSVLGMIWNQGSDTLELANRIPMRSFTKRGVISTVNSVYDPIGMGSPVTLAGRLIQRGALTLPDSANSAGLSWDEPLPAEYFARWDEWIKSLDHLDLLKVPRSYYPINLSPGCSQELHIFVDASLVAIGYVIFIRTIDHHNVYINFVTAGSKLAPRAATSVPRLELCGALQGSKAAYEVRRELGISHSKCHYYTDSRVIIGYLLNRKRHFKRYVSRRVDLIANLTADAPWAYVATRQNPADLACRPHTPEQLARSSWLSGPEFLADPSFSPSPPSTLIDYGDLPEIDPSPVISCKVGITSHQDLTILGTIVRECGSLKKILGVTQVSLALLHSLDVCRQKMGVQLAPRPPYLHVSKRDSVSRIILDCQMETSVADLASSGLSPFVDDFGIIRVGGRIRHSFLPFDGKHPIVIPGDHPLGLRIIAHYHEEKHHQGRSITMSAVRAAGYYIVKCRPLVDKFIRNCVVCRRLRGQPRVPLMGDLPQTRLEETPPFTYVGIDLFGPFCVTEGIKTRRTPGNKKAWGVVFLCLVCRAVHVEVVMGLDAVSFRNSLRRFIALRGVPRSIYSDNGTNLVAVKRQMEDSSSFSALEAEAKRWEIDWITSPPLASHFGGSWERCIGSIRKILDACMMQLGYRAISRDELDTLFKECMAIINSTPLYDACTVEEFPRLITPQQLMTLKDAPNPPELERFGEADLNAYGGRRWRRVQHLSDEFFRRWRDSYLATLQKRAKWKSCRPNLTPGDLVLLKDKLAQRNAWKTGIVSSVSPSKDGVVRSCYVRTTSGIFRRAVADLVLLQPSVSTDVNSESSAMRVLGPIDR